MSLHQIQRWLVLGLKDAKEKFRSRETETMDSVQGEFKNEKLSCMHKKFAMLYHTGKRTRYLRGPFLR